MKLYHYANWLIIHYIRTWLLGYLQCMYTDFAIYHGSMLYNAGNIEQGHVRQLNDYGFVTV